MTVEIQFPIFVVDKSDRSFLQVFRSREHAECGLEYPDVVNCEYQAWDCDGQPLELSTQSPRADASWLIMKIYPRPPEPDSLIKMLVQYAELHGFELIPNHDESPTDVYRRIELVSSD